METPRVGVVIVILLATTTIVSGLVKSEQQLIDALSSSSRIVITRSITISKELPPITRSVTITGHARMCKQASCYIDAQSLARHFTVSSKQGRLSLYNLELRNGKSSYEDGGAILVTDSASLEVSGATFFANEVAMFSVGGAIGVTNGSSASISRTSFVKNEAGFGAGVGVSDNSTADVRDSAFRDNIAILSGGGLEFFANSQGLLASNVYENNSATIGGAATAHDSTINICEASFIENIAKLDGPSIMAEGASQITVCKASATDVSGTAALEDCSPCSAVSGPLPGIRGDPHIRGPHGETFDFRGTPGQSYCLISDGDLQINMRVMTAEGSSTYIKELGLIYVHQSLWLSSLSGNSATNYQGMLVVNKEEMAMDSTTWSFPNNVFVSRTRNEVIVEVPNRICVSLRIAKPAYNRPSFLNLQVLYFHPALLSVDGIFGRLYGSLQGSVQFEGSGRSKSLIDPESYKVQDILSLH